MKEKCDHKNPLQRGGLSRQQRKLLALDPSFAKLDDRSTEDLLQYAFRLAGQINYFNNENDFDGNWETFWDIINEKSIEEIEASANNEPHFALFLCFLKLFSHAQNQLNTLTGRHLDFYYKKVLQLKEKREEPDKAHLIIELAKNASQQLLEKGTKFLAGKDAIGMPLTYAAEEDTVINKAKVELLRSVYRNENQLHIAAVANSADGFGEEPIDENDSWDAFGNDLLPVSSIGFALASPILELHEGVRTVSLLMTLFSPEAISITEEQMRSGFEIYASGAEDWLGPFHLNDESSISKVDRTSSAYLLKLQFEIPNDEEAIVNYNPAVLSGGFNSQSPIVRIVLNPGTSPETFTQLENTTLLKLKIEAEVTGIKNLTIENDLGLLDASKPFLPFGPVPTFGSNFYIGSKEAFTKKLISFQLNTRWKDLPLSLKNHYKNYKNGHGVANNESFKAKLQVLSGKNWDYRESVTLFKNNSATKETFIDFSNNANATSSARKGGYRISKTSKKSRQVYLQSHVRTITPKSFVPLFEKGTRFKRIVKKKKRKRKRRIKFLRKLNLSPLLKDGFIRLALEKDFGHKAFPSLYAIAISSQVNPDVTNIPLPNEPYTPSIESLTLDYHAETEEVDMKVSAAAENTFEEREIQYFHLAPFGHSEEHSYLKAELPFEHNTSVNLLPQHPNIGEFYIGLKDIEPNQSLNLLLQLDEGTANPERTAQDIKWSILSNNHWMDFDENHLLADHTNHLLTSGIIKFIIPRYATDDNTLLDEDYYWLRASIAGSTDAVCQFKGVHPQAITVVFNNQNNDPKHLETALEGETISKMANRLPSIKKVQQPYSSFGGKTEENASDFYTRVSERLRHKNRAITIWDYEHLVLENFPEIYKVKCLNHTSATSELSPGNVYMICIPDLQNRNTINILKPKARANILTEIQDFLTSKSSLFTTILAQNPDYEEILLEFDISFHKAFEFGFYKQVLNEDLKKFLTPWAYEKTKDISFGGRIHKSVIINFIDGLEYVDFITNFNMYHVDEDGNRSPNLDVVETSSSKAILVSAEAHLIKQTSKELICQ